MRNKEPSARVVYGVTVVPTFLHLNKGPELPSAHVFLFPLESRINPVSVIFHLFFCA